MLTPKQTERFWSKVEKTASCWLWTACLNPNGYGHLRVDKADWAAHRLSWEIHRGPIPDGLWVLHHCDNPPCINPAHLFLGTCRDNHADMIAKGRKVTVRLCGELSGVAKLTAQKVVEIRALRATGLTQQAIADRFGVTQRTISYIESGRVWRDVA